MRERESVEQTTLRSSMRSKSCGRLVTLNYQPSNMSASFTPSNAVDMSNERTWPADLGMLDWDSTSIVFTKRSLIEFLKYTGTTVDPNFGTIAKLPRYAKFGKISYETGSVGSSTAQATDNSVDSSSGGTDDAQASGQVKPSGSHDNIFGTDDSGDALSAAPPARRDNQEPTPSTTTIDPAASLAPPQIRSSRRVRTSPGGASSIGSIFESEDTLNEFKPTRKVREGPGGQDHIGSLF